jgi:hypothetical protein
MFCFVYFFFLIPFFLELVCGACLKMRVLCRGFLLAAARQTQRVSGGHAFCLQAFQLRYGT